MRRLRYLNTILTVIAVLLALNAYALWTATPGGAMLDHAQAAHAQAGVPNAAEQRRQMIDLLKQTNVHLSDVKTTLRSGVKVISEPQGD
jgi:hypothetical protein